MKETLYDNNGTPIAYLDKDDGNTFYLWNGVPVAYLDKAYAVYGFNGMQLGWYFNGYMRDLKGYIVGFNKQSVSIEVKASPIKSFKMTKPVKKIKQIIRTKPIWKRNNSVICLSQFLANGIK